MGNLNLPEPITTYFDADRRDGAATARCFTSQAVVKDEGQTHTGPAAIKAWQVAAAAKYSYTSEPFAVAQQDGQYIVSSRLTGDFPRSPVDLRYIFRLESNKIAFLEITP